MRHWFMLLSVCCLCFLLGVDAAMAQESVCGRVCFLKPEAVYAFDEGLLKAYYRYIECDDIRGAEAYKESVNYKETKSTETRTQEILKTNTRGHTVEKTTVSEDKVGKVHNPTILIAGSHMAYLPVCVIEGSAGSSETSISKLRQFGAIETFFAKGDQVLCGGIVPPQADKVTAGMTLDDIRYILGPQQRCVPQHSIKSNQYSDIYIWSTRDGGEFKVGMSNSTLNILDAPSGTELRSVSEWTQWGNEAVRALVAKKKVERYAGPEEHIEDIQRQMRSGSTP